MTTPLRLAHLLWRKNVTYGDIAAATGLDLLTIADAAEEWLSDELDQKERMGLNAALEEVDHCDEEAREEGYPPPSIIAKQNAAGLLRELSGNPSVYPTADGEIAIFFKDDALLFLCEADGGVTPFASVQQGQSLKPRHFISPEATIALYGLPSRGVFSRIAAVFRSSGVPWLKRW